MACTFIPRGRDAWGVVHLDSGAKCTYIWPVCRTPYLMLARAPIVPVTCLKCLANAVTYEYEGA